ncbi:MAG: hypothetical protein U1E69_14570 [Tabrizicola sp.]|uniref:hypothetical protein n=1 Tax=Tabrizicola sp. TaxID=2005166 RepID=UPI002ABA3F2B|nr:hypothetical protein [Tabrizicola sp.]MDZ4088012.1 hypothetical protein [Tabrizicola sp.]
MIDRAYLFLLLLIAALMLQAKIITVAAPVIIVLGLIWLGLLVFERLALILAPQLQRDLMGFRSNPKLAILGILGDLDLERPHPREALTEKAEALATAAQAVSLRHPNPLYGPVRLDSLTEALMLHLPHQNHFFIVELQRVWTGPLPGVTTLGGLWLFLRRSIGAVLFPGASEDIDGPAVTWWYYQKMTDRPQPDTDETKWALVKAKVLYDTRAGLAQSAGFDPVTVQTVLLPLRSQRLLQAAASVLSGDPAQIRMARLLNPSHRAFLSRVADVPDELPAAPAWAKPVAAPARPAQTSTAKPA